MKTTSTTTVHHHGSAQLSRLMLPSDANVAGNVHGGTIMQFMEEAAGVAAHRYFYSSSNRRDAHKVVAFLSRVERLSFAHPVYVGDVAKIQATVVFASQHSVAVCVQVRAERMPWSNTHSEDVFVVGSELVCNRALLWLVGVYDSDYQTRAMAPLFPVPKDPQSWEWKHFQEASSLYQQANTAVTHSSNAIPIPITQNPPQTAAATTAHSIAQAEIAQVMLPSDCVNSTTGLVAGGVVLKLMDTACGIVAVRHCGTVIVTVAVAGVHFLTPGRLGDVLMVSARPIFTSPNSLEIAVWVRAERYSRDPETGFMKPQIVNITEPAIFTFVALPLATEDPPVALPMKPLQCLTQQDREIFDQRLLQYNQRRAMTRNGDISLVAKL